MDSVLRDINREESKMQADVDNLHRHYEKLQGYVRQYIEQTTIEWAKLVVSHPKALLLLVETTRIVDDTGYSHSGESEPIRFTTISLASGEVWDQLISPSYSKGITGSEYHGLQWSDLEDKPTISDAWLSIADLLEGRQLIIFGADYARQALHMVNRLHLLDGAYCLHNKCKEYYNQFYDLSLEKVLSYQGIDKKREELRDSRDRLLMLLHVINNLAAGMAKSPEPTKVVDDLDDLDEHPF